jgi:DEAD/DEAH box helicase domain-containing protein
VDEASVFSELHQGALYLHQGDSYIVEALDLVSRTAILTQADVPYYTRARELVDLRVLALHRQKKAGATTVYLGEVEVSTTVVAFKKLAQFTDQVLGEEALDLPPYSFRTIALWWDIPEETFDYISERRLDLAGGLHAAEHAAIGVLPLFALCDRNDIGGLSTPLHPDTGKPQVFIYDGHPGGVGIAEGGFNDIEELWQATADLVSGCPCQAGCPACVQSPKCGNNNEPLDKGVAVIVLRGLLGKGLLRK